MFAASLTSRTVPMNAATAPTRGSPARNAASSRAISKSEVCMRTVIAVVAASAAGDRRKQRDLVAGPDHRFRARELVIDGEEQRSSPRAPGRDLARPALAACGEPRAERGNRRQVRRDLDALGRDTQGLAQARKIDERQRGGHGVAHALSVVAE